MNTTTTIYRVNHAPGGSYTEWVTEIAADIFRAANEIIDPVEIIERVIALTE
jgi:hypothetical protein